MIFLVIVLVRHLAWVFLGSIRIVVPTAMVKYINGIDSRSWDRAFFSLFLDVVTAVFFLFFSSFFNGLFGALGGCWPSFLDLRLRLLSPRIFHEGSLMASLIVFCRSFITGDALVYPPEHGGE